jgi:hypothetical protein
MASEMQSVSRHVKGTTAAVVTMQSAVIMAENNSANKVCSNVNRGFFMMVRSQISQKIANKQSRVEALLIQLAQQKRRLLGIKSNMEREYGRIAERYLRIFTGINKELEVRIRQLDQPVFELVNHQMATSSNRMNALSSIVPTSQVEGLTKSQQIMMSEMKHNAQVALEQSYDFLTQIGEQRVLTNKVLISRPDDNGEKTCHIPVLICETVNDAQQTSRTEIDIPADFSNNGANQVYSAIRGSNDLPWAKAEMSPVVGDEFSRLLDASKASARVKDLIRKMYAKSDFETI